MFVSNTSTSTGLKTSPTNHKPHVIKFKFSASPINHKPHVIKFKLSASPTNHKPHVIKFKFSASPTNHKPHVIKFKLSASPTNHKPHVIKFKLSGVYPLSGRTYLPFFPCISLVHSMPVLPEDARDYATTLLMNVQYDNSSGSQRRMFPRQRSNVSAANSRASTPSTRK